MDKRVGCGVCQSCGDRGLMGVCLYLGCGGLGGVDVGSGSLG